MPLSADNSLSVLSREPKRPKKFTEAFARVAFVRVAVKLSKKEHARETKLEKIPKELPEIEFGPSCEICVGPNRWILSKKLRAV